MVIRGDDLRFKTKLYGQFAHPGLFCHPGIRTALDDKSVAANGLNYAAQSRRGFKECELGVAFLRELVCGRDAAEPTADDGDPSHCELRRAIPPRARSARASIRKCELFSDSGRRSS